MRQKNRYVFANANYLFENSIMKPIFITAVLVIIYFCITKHDGLSYFDALIACLTNPQFLCLGFFPLFFFVNMQLYTILEENIYFISRLKGQREYLNYLLYNIVVVNSILFLFFLILVVIVFNFFVGSNIGIHYISTFHTYNILYLLYTVLKLYLVLVILSMITFLLFKLFSKSIAFLFSLLFCGFLFYFGFQSIIPCTGIQNMMISIIHYLLNIISFDSFGVNIFCFCMNFLFLCLFSLVLYIFSLKFMKKVGI